MPKRPDIDHIRKELESRRSRVKEQFENRIGEAKKKAEYYRERMHAQREKRDARIAEVEESLSKRADATLRKHLRAEDYKRLQNWLLEKKKEEMHKLEGRIQPTEGEDFQRQIEELRKTDPKDLVLYYFNNENKFREEIKRDIGLEI